MGGVLVNDQYALNMMSVSGDFEKERKYWQQKLQDDLTPVTFPYDYIVSSQGQRYMISKSYECPQQLSEQLLAFCNQSDYGLYMIFLSSFQFLLNTYTQHVDIIIGSPILRDEKQATPSNRMLPLRMMFDSMSSFKASLSDIKRTVI